MRRKLVTLLALGAALAIGGRILGSAAADTSADEAVARDFVRLGFEQQDLKAAFEKYVAPDLIEHDPEFGDGRDAVFKYIEARHKAHPDEYLPTSEWRNHMDYVALKGDMLITKMHVFSRRDDRGRVFADFWRLKDGKIVEHWDVIQEVPADKANPRDMW